MRFSVIIPTRNRPVPLDRCLKAIDALDYCKTRFEVLVVDDGSDPPVDEVIQRHAAFLPLRHFRETGRGPAHARNRALREAKGQYVVFTDDDCLPHSQWLVAYDRAFHHHPTACLGGPIVSSPENGICADASQSLISFLYENATGSAPFIPFFCSNNLALGRSATLAIGGFDETFPVAAAEDRDICARFAARGELRFVPEAVVEHRQDLNIRSFCSQHHRYGRGAYQFWTRRIAAGHDGRRNASLAFYYQMLRSPFAQANFSRALLISALIALSQACGAAGYLNEKLRTR
jgi:glycosyltransferase involved in cell wall biosynthesis